MSQDGSPLRSARLLLYRAVRQHVDATSRGAGIAGRESGTCTVQYVLDWGQESVPRPKVTLFDSARLGFCSTLKDFPTQFRKAVYICGSG